MEQSSVDERSQAETTGPEGQPIPVDGVSSRGTRRPPPRQRRKPHTLPQYVRRPCSSTHHGRVHHDDFHWLSDRRDPHVQRLLHAENDLVSRFFQTAAPGLQRALCKEMRARAKLDDASLPTVDRHFWYYTRQVKNEEYSLYCRRPYSREESLNVDFLEEVSALWRHDPSAPLPYYDDEVILLDPNLLQRELGLDFIEIGDMDVSPDERRLAVTLDCSGGREIFTLFVVDIKDVNYRHWIDHDAGDVYRAWARDMTRKDASIYGSPTSSLSSRTSASTPTLFGPSPSESAAPRARKGAASRTCLSSSPQAGSPAASTSPSPGTANRHARSSSQFPSKPCSPFLAGPRAPQPSHHILHRVDMFDLSNEVLWVSDTSLLYVAVDDKMRPFQLVHHDLRIADDAPEASVICYEEADEEFWVGAVGFTVDERYVTFSTASSEVSEWYVCPHKTLPRLADARQRTERHRCLDGAPVVRAFTDGSAVGKGGLEDPVWQEALESGRALATTCCFARRQTYANTDAQHPSSSSVGLEYELDHHATLLRDSREIGDGNGVTTPGAGLGAWVIVSNARGHQDSALFILPDSEVDIPDGAASTSPTAVGCEARWQQLLETEPHLKLEGVEVCLDYLLLSVRRTGILTVLLLPVSTVRAWWAAVTPVGGSVTSPSATGASHDDSQASHRPPLPLSELVDLSLMLQRVQPSLLAWRRHETHSATQPETVGEDSVTCTLSELCAWQQRQRKTASPPRDGSAEATRSTGAMTDEDEQARACGPLPFTIEAYGSSTCFCSTRFRVHVGHLVHPTVVYEVQYLPSAGDRGASLTIRQLRTEAVNGPFEEDAYTAAVLWVPSAYSFTHKAQPDAMLVPTAQPSADVMVPVYLCWNVGACGMDTVSLDGRNHVEALKRRPLLLNAYGSYGDCAELDFCSERLSLLDRGFVWGYAGVRGGGELGIGWRDQGRKHQRATAVNDLISVSSFLQDRGYCARGQLSLSGGSAGGLVVVRAALQAPQLFHAVVAAVPFVDCLTTLLDAALPLTVTEWSECGNPAHDVNAYDLLETLTPVEVLGQWAVPRPPNEAGVPRCAFPPKWSTLPHMLLETALGDARVGYWEPLKMMAHLRELYPLHPVLQLSASHGVREECVGAAGPPHGGTKDAVGTCQPDLTSPSSSAGVLLHYCDFLNGHGGANGRFQQWEETAREYAFLIACQQELF